MFHNQIMSKIEKSIRCDEFAVLGSLMSNHSAISLHFFVIVRPQKVSCSYWPFKSDIAQTKSDIFWDIGSGFGSSAHLVRGIVSSDT